MDVRPQRKFSAPSASTTAASPANSTSNSQPPSGKKRRTSASGSRGVANLTPEQLAKKRANDREAQRAIRERTKGQIETLERKIHDLTSQQPYQDLQQVIQQKEAVEAENEDMKKRLNSVLSIIQPLLGGDGNHGKASPTGGAICWPRLSKASTDLNPPAYRNGGQPPSYLPTPVAEAGSREHNNISSSASSYLEHASLRDGTSMSPINTAAQGRQQNAVIQSPATYAPHTAFTPALDHQKNNIAHGLDLRSSGEKLDLGFLLGGRQEHRQDGVGAQAGPQLPDYSLLTPLTATKSPNCNSQGNPSFEISTLAHKVPVRNTGPSCPLDGLLLDFLAEQRARAAEGISPQKLVGPAYPSVSSLLNPERSKYSHPLSKVFTDILRTFPDLCTLPEQVAVLYIMFLVMRWNISLTQETYDRLPDWMTPRATQLFSPHPAWIDNLPWPRMRDRMVQVYPQVHFDNFFIPYTTTLSLNWPYEASDCLLKVPGSEELSINPIFEQHLRDLNNWSLGPAFAKAFPILAETTKIRDVKR